MNILTYTISADSSLDPTSVVTLYFDGKQLKDIVVPQMNTIPVWMFKDDLPHYPPSDQTSKKRIIGVCSCGEYGCGRILCNIEQNKDTVTFTDSWDGYNSEKLEHFSFTFSRENYDDVIKGILRDINNVKK